MYIPMQALKVYICTDVHTYTHCCTCVNTHFPAERSVHVWTDYICIYYTILNYTILYSCIQIVHNIHTSYISHIQTHTVYEQNMNSTFYAHIITHGYLNYLHIYIFIHTVYLRLAFLFYFIFRQGLTMSL